MGNGVDGAIQRIERSYDVRGMLKNVTTYDAASGGSVVNHVALRFDAFSNLMSDQQSHDGTVAQSTPKVSYAYADARDDQLAGQEHHARSVGQRPISPRSSRRSVDLIAHPAMASLTGNQNLRGSLSRRARADAYVSAAGLFIVC